MPDPMPGPGPDGERPASASGRRYLDWQALLDALAAAGLLGGDPGAQDAAGGQDGAGEQAAGLAGGAGVPRQRRVGLFGWFLDR
jgi:hypothetical protein